MRYSISKSLSRLRNACLRTSSTRSKILWVRPGAPCAARRLCSPLRQAMQCSIASGDLHHIRVDIVCVAADTSGFPGKRELNVAFLKCQLGFLALGDVSRQALDAQEPARGVKFALRRLLQPDLTSIRAAKAEIQDIRGLPGLSSRSCDLKVSRSSGWTRPRNSLAQRASRSTLVIQEYEPRCRCAVIGL